MLCIGAHELYQLVIDDFNNHLCRGQGLQNVSADTALGNGLCKILADLIVDVCFQQCHTDFAHGLLHVSLFQAAFAAKLFEGIIDFFS